MQNNKKIKCITVIGLLVLTSLFSIITPVAALPQIQNNITNETSEINEPTSSISYENSTIKGYITDKNTSDPIQNAAVTLYFFETALYILKNSTLSNESGYYSMNVSPGIIYIAAYLSGFTQGAVGPIEIEENETIWVNISLINDITSPDLSNLLYDSNFSIYEPGNISIDVSDDNLFGVKIGLTDNSKITFNKSIEIWNYYNYSGQNGSYKINNYMGNYGQIFLEEKSSPSSIQLFENWMDEGKIYSYANFRLNESTTPEVILLEFNELSGELTDLFKPVFLPDLTFNLEFFSNMIDPGNSTIISLCYSDDLLIEYDDNNYTLFEIGDSENPKFQWSPLSFGIYETEIVAQDRALNDNIIMFNINISHDVDPPIIIDETDDEAVADDDFLFITQVTDDINVSAVYVKYKYEFGSWLNITLEKTDEKYWEKKIIVGNQSDYFDYTISAVDDTGNWANTDPIHIDVSRNHKPSTPSIDGTEEGNAGNIYEYSFVATDEDAGDKIYYIVDWGDGDIIEFGPHNSGQIETAVHTWDEQNNYTIRAKTRDLSGAESNWVELEVSMPIIKQNIPTFFDRIQDRFPILYQLLLDFIERFIDFKLC